MSDAKKVSENCAFDDSVPWVLHADALEKLTGLHDRRHRQLAHTGYFPMPKDGMYQLTPTIRGMFKYYREEFQRSNKALMDDRQIKLKREIHLLDLQISEEEKKMIPLPDVERVWAQACVALRQVILASDVSTSLKEELCRQLRDVPIDEYLQTTSSVGAEEVPAADSAAA